MRWIRFLISCEINESSAEAKSVQFAEQAVVTQDQINSFVQLVQTNSQMVNWDELWVSWSTMTFLAFVKCIHNYQISQTTRFVGLSSQDDKLSNALVHEQIPAQLMASPSVSAVFSFRNWISFIAKYVFTYIKVDVIVKDGQCCKTDNDKCYHKRSESKLL